MPECSQCMCTELPLCWSTKHSNNIIVLNSAHTTYSSSLIIKSGCFTFLMLLVAIWQLYANIKESCLFNILDSNWLTLPYATIRLNQKGTNFLSLYSDFVLFNNAICVHFQPISAVLTLFSLKGWYVFMLHFWKIHCDKLYCLDSILIGLAGSILHLFLTMSLFNVCCFPSSSMRLRFFIGSGKKNGAEKRMMLRWTYCWLRARQGYRSTGNRCRYFKVHLLSGATQHVHNRAHDLVGKCLGGWGLKPWLFISETLCRNMLHSGLLM